jgi:hypothetical protein
MQKGVESTPKSPIGATEEEEAFAYHYTTAKAFEKIQSSGVLKSRALLISEELRSRPDWETIEHDPKAILAALPPYATISPGLLPHSLVSLVQHLFEFVH